LAALAIRAPYYREAFKQAAITPADLSEATLERMSVLEKASLRASELPQTLADPEAKLFPINTSGSTGIPLQVLRTSRDQAEVSALWARIFSAYGRRTFDRQVKVGSGRSVAKKGPVARLRQLGTLPELHRLASFDPPKRQIALLRRVRPQMISA
jgi:phenylacetate-coenzyme A ligase PaaK-like adenylate-forming protein